MIVTVYIDESGTHGPSPIMTLGGWVGRWGQWDSFDPKWKKLLAANDLTYFHSRMMKHSKGEFRGWSLPKRRKFIADSSELLRKHTLFGFSFALRKEEYATHYIAGDRPKKEMLDSQYGVCFRACLSFLPRMIREELPDRKEVDLYFVLESGGPNFGDVVRIFNLVKDHGPPETARMLRSVTAGAKKEFPGLQAADLNAYLSLHGERQANPRVFDLPKRATVETARKLARHAPVIRFQITPDVLADLRAAVLEKEERRALRALASRLGRNDLLKGTVE